MSSSSRLPPWPYPRIFAHRGGGRLAPENTCAAIVTGASWGYRAVEFDVKLSRDDIAFLLHDDTVNRTSNGCGNARDFDYADLARLDAGAWHSRQFEGERLPRFDTAIATVQAHQMMANVEIKPCPGREADTGRLVAQMAAAAWQGAAVPPLLSSFSATALAAAHEAAPHLPRAWLTKTPQAKDWLILESLGCVAFHFWEQAAQPGLIDEAHARGYRVLLWTVNNVERAKTLFGWGVDGVFTDELDAFQTI
jgi:glycerophosphoryl diester phosphodiesterase